MDQLIKYLIQDHPEATAAILVLFGGVYFNYRLNRKNIIISHRIELHKKLSEQIRQIQRNIYALISTYQSTIDQTANIGDRYLGKDLGAALEQVAEDALKKDVENHYEALKKLVHATYEARDKILGLVAELSDSSLIPKKLKIAVKTLHAEFNMVDADLEQTKDLITVLDPLPKPSTDLTTTRISVELFRLVNANARLTKVKLDRFNSLVTDFDNMLHNDLVGAVLGKKKEETVAKIQLTRKGMFDKRTHED